MSLKEIEALIKLCRKTGVSSISTPDVTLTLTSEAPQSAYKRRTKKSPPDPFEQAMAESKDAATKAKLKYMSEQHRAQQAQDSNTETPDEEAMLFWSAGGGDGAQQ